MQKLKSTKRYNVQIVGCADLTNPPIKKGPQGGRYQPEGRKDKRYLLEGKPIKTGPQGGKFQVYKDRHGHTAHRHLLHKK